MLFGYASSLSPIIPILLFEKEVLKKDGLLEILIFLISILCIQIPILILSKYETNNLWLFHLGVPINLLIYGIFLLKVIGEKKWLFILFISLIELFLVYNIFKIDINNSINEIGLSILSGCYLIGSVYINLNLYQMNIYHLEKNSIFWINNAFLIFGSSRLIMNILSGYIFKNFPDLFRDMQTFHNFFNLVFYLMIAYGIWLARKKPQSSPLLQEE